MKRYKDGHIFVKIQLQNMHIIKYSSLSSSTLHKVCGRAFAQRIERPKSFQHFVKAMTTNAMQICLDKFHFFLSKMEFKIRFQFTVRIWVHRITLVCYIISISSIVYTLCILINRNISELENVLFRKIICIQNPFKILISNWT